MQFAGKPSPTIIVVLFVTFFPLQGFFNLVVYMFPRIMRYFEEGVPLTQSFDIDRRSSYLSSLFATARNSINLRKSSRVSFAFGVAENNEQKHAREVNDGRNDDNEIELERGATDDYEKNKVDEEKDFIDELQSIVEA